MGTIKTTNIESISGSGTVTLGTSGETFTFASGVTGTSYPAFQARLSANQYGVADNTATKINFNTELFDTANAYDNSSNYRFTPQTAGKYLIYSTQRIITTNNGQLRSAILYLYKNGSAVTGDSSNFNMNDEGVRAITPSLTSIVDMNGSSDYVEIFGLHFSIDSATTSSGFHSTASIFGAYRIGT